MLHERSLHRMQIPRLTKPFNRSNLIPLMHRRKRKTRVDAPPIHMNRTSPTLPMVATLLRPRKARMLPQTIKQRSPRINLKAHSLPVDPQIHSNRTLNLLFPSISSHDCRRRLDSPNQWPRRSRNSRSPKLRQKRSPTDAAQERPLSLRPLLLITHGVSPEHPQASLAAP